MSLYKTKKDVLLKSQEAIGKTFGEMDINKRLTKVSNKGGLGQVVEEGHFKYEVNSNAQQDFKEAGVELKVTPYKRNKNGTYSAKERLVLNIIDYNNEYKYEFENSSFWRKNQSLLLMFYLFESEKEREDLKITHSLLFEYPEEDLKIIKSDWEHILDMINSGRAHDLSESQTMYLGACPKGSGKGSTRSQPFSGVRAMQRAFSLKQSYMTSILRKYVLGEAENEKVIKNINDLESKSFEDIVIKKLSKYYGKSKEELLNEFNIKSKAKNINEIIVSRMLGIKGKLSATEEFQKANIIPKTIRIEADGNKIKESMSFPTFKFTKIVKEEWKSSTLREMFESTKWLFLIFQFNYKGDLYFKRAIFWRMPIYDLDNYVKKAWDKTVEVINKGNIVNKIKNGKVYNNFPGMSENSVCHVRPHARNKNDVYKLPVPDLKTGKTNFTKQCFWLNSRYIVDKLFRS